MSDVRIVELKVIADKAGDPERIVHVNADHIETMEYVEVKGEWMTEIILTSGRKNYSLWPLDKVLKIINESPHAHSTN